MVTKEEFETLTQKIDVIYDTIVTHQKSAGKQFEMLNNRLTLFINENYEPKAEPKIVITAEGNAMIAEPVMSFIEKKPKDAPKIPPEGLGKIPDNYKIATKACSSCLKMVAWPPFKKDADLGPGEKRDPPIHCDGEGNIIGDGGHW